MAVQLIRNITFKRQCMRGCAEERRVKTEEGKQGNVQKVEE